MLSVIKENPLIKRKRSIETISPDCCGSETETMLLLPPLWDPPKEERVYVRAWTGISSVLSDFTCNSTYFIGDIGVLSAILCAQSLYAYSRSVVIIRCSRDQSPRGSQAISLADQLASALVTDLVLLTN